jgi:hypothetical protein
MRTNRNVLFDDPGCVDPKAVCKWRTACPIRLLEKEAAGQTR